MCKYEELRSRGSGIGWLAAGDIPNPFQPMRRFVLHACVYAIDINIDIDIAMLPFFLRMGSLRVSAFHLLLININIFFLIL